MAATSSSSGERDAGRGHAGALPGLRLLAASARQAVDGWFRESGEGAVNALGTAFMAAAAAHVIYLGAVPEPLRVPVARRNVRLWKRLCLGAMVGVALYDTAHSSCLARQQQVLQADARRLRAELLALADGEQGTAPAAAAAAHGEPE